MSKTKIGMLLMALVIAGAVTSCITYRNFPAEYIGKEPAKEFDSATFSISSGTIFGGADRLKEVFISHSPFRQTEKLIERSATGTHVEIIIHPLSPTISAIVFGYLSVSTLTILPAWSTRDGYEVYYEVYKNGTKVKTFSYEIRRKTFLWILMLPVSMVNLGTYSEAEAFEATAYKFFEDARNILK